MAVRFPPQPVRVRFPIANSVALLSRLSVRQHARVGDII